MTRVGMERAVGLVAVSSVGYLDSYFDLLDAGRIVVPLRSASDRYRIEACRLDEIQVPPATCGWFTRRIALSDSSELAQVSFTSGTEGEPKGVRLTHANLSSTARRIQEVMRLDSSVREYVGVPVYHSFGLGRVRAVNALGGHTYIPPGGFDLRELVSMLREGSVNAISAVPSLWRVVLRNRAAFGDCAAQVRWIEIGSQPMTAAEKLDLRGLFPAARIVQHYGLTEASRSTFLVVSEATQAELESVGCPNGDVQIAISASGRIRIRGSHVASELISGGELVRSTDQDGWLTTSDLGQLRDGRLYFMGRADDVLNLAGVKISPDAIEEGMARLLPSREGYCVARIPDEQRGDGVLIAAQHGVSYADEMLVNACREALTSLSVHGASAIRVCRVDAIPRTESGKPKRREIAALFDASSSSVQQPRLGAAVDWLRDLVGLGDRSVRALFKRAFPGQTVSDDATFVNLGGDSLSYVELSMRLEATIGRLPDGWQNLTVRELSTYPTRSDSQRDVDITVLLRCVGMFGIVMGHFEIMDVGGATFMLLAVAGFNFARFLLPNVLRVGSTRPVLSFALDIALPTLFVLVLLQLRHGQADPTAMMLLDNWWTPGAADPYGFWFLELMIQIMLVFGVVLAIKPVRELAGRRPFFFAFGGMIASVALALLVPLVWNTDHLYNRLPHMLLWLFMLGWLAHVARHPWQKIMVGLLAAVLPPLIWEPVMKHYWLQHGMVWVWGGFLALSFLRRVRLPAWIAHGATYVGAASMFIYLSHFAIRNVWERVTGLEYKPLTFVVAILGGVVFWACWQAVERRVRRRWAARGSLSASTAEEKPRDLGI